MNPGPRAYKSASCRLAVPSALPKHMQDRVREIINIAATNPRKGHATAMMDRVCVEADVSCVVLLLTPRPFDDGMNQAQLEHWYARFGFVPIQSEPVLMARQPKAPARMSALTNILINEAAGTVQ